MPAAVGAEWLPDAAAGRRVGSAAGRGGESAARSRRGSERARTRRRDGASISPAVMAARRSSICSWRPAPEAATPPRRRRSCSLRRTRRERRSPRSVPLLQAADVSFLRKAGCVSCHHNSQTGDDRRARPAARLAVDETIARTAVRANQRLHGRLAGARAAGHWRLAARWIRSARSCSGSRPSATPADPMTDAFARFVRRQQIRRRTLAWPSRIARRSSPATSRKPRRSLRVIQLYAPPFEQTAADESVRRAAAWLRQAQPANFQERAYQLLGLAWSGAGRPAIRDAARAIVAQQRPDGGWSQIPTLESDAYATGEALVALRRERRAGAVRSRVYKRGVAVPAEDAARGRIVVRRDAAPSRSSPTSTPGSRTAAISSSRRPRRTGRRRRWPTRCRKD